MSVEGVLAFYKKADTDEALGKQIAQVGAGVHGALDEVAKIAVAAGFEVTASDLRSLEQAVQGPEGDGLSDDELSAVSGGSAYIKFDGFRQVKRLDVKKLRGGVSMSNSPTQATVVRHQVRWNR